MTPEKVLLRLDISHAVTDAMSWWVLLHEWSLLYAGRQPGRLAPSYGSYVDHLLTNSDPATQYWVRYLENIQPCLLLVTSTLNNGLGKLENVPIDLGGTSSLHELPQNHGFTIPTLVKSVWALMLRCWVGMSSVCFGYLDSGRHVPIAGIKETVGALINILVCRVHLDETIRFGEVLDSVQDDYHRSLPHHSSALHALDVLESTPPSQRIFNSLINYRRNQPVTSPEQERIVVDFISWEDGMSVSSILP